MELENYTLSSPALSALRYLRVIGFLGRAAQVRHGAIGSLWRAAPGLALKSAFGAKRKKFPLLDPR